MTYIKNINIYKKTMNQKQKIQIPEYNSLQVTLTIEEMQTAIRNIGLCVLGCGRGYFIGKSYDFSALH
jgi:hypothetical protein